MGLYCSRALVTLVTHGSYAWRRASSSPCTPRGLVLVQVSSIAPTLSVFRSARWSLLAVASMCLRALVIWSIWALESFSSWPFLALTLMENTLVPGLSV